VDQGELGCELAQDADGCRLVIDEDATLSVGRDLAAEQNVVGLGVDAVGFEDGSGSGCELEDAADDGFVGSVADEVGRGFAAEQEREGVDEDRLAGSGFAGEEVEAAAEPGLRPIDDGVIFGTQFQQHQFRLGFALAKDSMMRFFACCTGVPPFPLSFSKMFEMNCLRANRLAKY